MAAAAASYFSGPALMPSQRAGAPDYSAAGAATPSPSKSRNSGCVPATVLHISRSLAAAVAAADVSGDPVFSVDGVETSSVRVVGKVENVVSREADVAFTLDDGTGKIPLVRRINDEADARDVAYIKAGVYLRVHVNITGFQAKQWSAPSIRPITNFDDVVLHFIECIHVHMENTWPNFYLKVGKGQTSNFGVSDSSVSVPPLTSGSILAMPPCLSSEKFLEAYDVVLVLDDREKIGPHGEGVVGRILSEFSVAVERKRLPVGDAIWIARHRTSQREYVLDFIVERKCVKDLASSIIDNRYKDQKLRLKECGLSKLIYLVEGDPNSLSTLDSVKVTTACLTTEIMDGFDVQRTTGYPDTERTYGHLTHSIIDYYRTNFSASANTSQVCLTYDDFVKKCSDLKKLTVSDIFAIQLMLVPQVTEETALAVTTLYPTLHSLAQAYSMLDGKTHEQEQMLSKKSKTVKSAASRNIFKLVWGEG